MQYYKRKILPTFFQSYKKAKEDFRLVSLSGVKDDDYWHCKVVFRRYKRWYKETVEEYKDLKAKLKECNTNGL